MQALTICLIYSGIIVLYFLIRKLQYNKRQKNVVNFYQYYNRKNNEVNKDTKGSGEIIYLIPPKSMDKKLFPRHKDDAE